MRNIIILIIIANIIYRFFSKVQKSNATMQGKPTGNANKNQFSIKDIAKKQKKANQLPPGYNPDNVYETEFDMTKKQTGKHKKSKRRYATSARPNASTGHVKYSDPSWVKDEDTWIKGE